MNTTKRFSIAILCAAAALGTSALALADAGDAKPQCDGKHDGKVSQAELQQARKDGKLPHGKRAPKA